MRVSTRVPRLLGQAITMGSDKVLRVPDNPILPYIEGDGTGPDIWRSSQRVFDAAVQKAYNGRRKVEWLEVLAGEKAFVKTKSWLPEETLTAFKKYLVGIKGPLTTPVGGGIRSLNVALRQLLDLYVCLRPVKYFKGVPSPVRNPHLVNTIIFRENTEDIYAGVEFQAGSPQVAALMSHLTSAFPKESAKIRFPNPAGLGIGLKPVSREGSERLVRAAIEYALAEKRKSVTIVHKGNIMKFTEGAFRDWGYDLARSGEYRGKVVTERETWILDNAAAKPGLTAEENAKLIDPGYDMMTPAQRKALCEEVTGVMSSIGATHGGGQWKSKKLLVVRDAIADITLQQILTRPEDFDVIATMNLNGDYLSDALAAQVGGIGIAPGANINYDTGAAIFEATHGTAPKYANLDKVNPGSVILSGEMMFRHMGWKEAADAIMRGLDRAIASRNVTYDFHRQMDSSSPKKLLKCSEFGDEIISKM